MSGSDIWRDGTFSARLATTQASQAAGYVERIVWVLEIDDR